jgi:hypothetical protein
VQTAVYEVKLDTIAVMRTSRQSEYDLFNSASPKVLSVVAFACALTLSVLTTNNEIASCTC